MDLCIGDFFGLRIITLPCEGVPGVSRPLLTILFMYVGVFKKKKRNVSRLLTLSSWLELLKGTLGKWVTDGHQEEGLQDWSVPSGCTEVQGSSSLGPFSFVTFITFTIKNMSSHIICISP